MLQVNILLLGESLQLPRNQSLKDNYIPQSLLFLFEYIQTTNNISIPSAQFHNFSFLSFILQAEIEPYSFIILNSSQIDFEGIEMSYEAAST